MSSLPYWESRWSADGSFHASWPDTFARLLELKFIEDYFPVSSYHVLELGCGPLSLDESHELAWMIRRCYFMGIDGSEAAIRVAEARHPEGSFRIADLEDLELKWPSADFLICRRTIQNLAPAHRLRIIERLQDYPRGVLIESTVSGLLATNARRADAGLAPLVEPEFNTYLNQAEETAILKMNKARKISFLDTYYAQTRVANLAGWNTGAHTTAYYDQLSAPEVENGLGPVQGFVWGQP